MRLEDIKEGSRVDHQHQFKEMFARFLPIAIEILNLKSLPEFHFEAFLDHPQQPTFGMYVNGENKLYVGLSGRHPNDIFRTIAHELTHYKQDTEHMLDDRSGETGSPIENQANAMAGIIMRHFNKTYPDYLRSKPVMEDIDVTDESLKGLAAAGLIGLGMLGGPKDVASGNLPQDLQKAQQQHRVQMAKKPMAKPAATKPAAAKPLPAKATPLLKVAKANGIKGVELAQFLAQMEHESLDFKKMKELGKSTYFNKYDPKHNPKLANKLGNKFKGDGLQFRGRGFIQLTGRENYTQASRDIFGDDRLVKKPDLAAQPDIAARIAVWYWTDRVKPLVKDFSDTTRVTKIINGGLNGLEDRENNFRDYMASLGLMEKWSMKYKKSINCANPKGFSQRAHCQGRKKTEDVEQDPGDPIPFPAGTTSVDVSDPYDWYKLGMVISDLDDANPQAFGRGGPSTVIAFGSEDEEHRLLPYLKRLGLKLKDIDKPSDTRKIVPAKAVLDKLEEGFKLDELNINQTLAFIKQAHGDQLYGKLPYWTHPRAVAMTGKKIFGNKFNSDAVKVAFLHDVVEDTNISIDELGKLDFSPQVIEAVSLLTKNKTLTYRQNIENIINSGNPLAMMVKYADNYENYSGDKSDWDSARAASSQKKYLMSLNMLGSKLGVKHHEQNLKELGTTQYKVTEPRDMVNVDFRSKQITYKVFKFKVDKQVFLIVLTVKDQAMPGSKKKVPTLNVAFGRQDKNGWDVDDIDTNLTGDNQNQFQIYSTVIKAIQKFITQLNPNVAQIIIKGDNERQQVMYDRFFNSRYLEKFFPGWQLNPTTKTLIKNQSQNLKELLDPKLAIDLDWAEGSDYIAARGYVTVTDQYGNKEDVELEVEFGEFPQRNRKEYEVQFKVGDSYDITGGGNANVIFATVIQACKDFVEMYKPDRLFFTAKEQSRARMYDTLTKRVAKQVGWHVIPFDEIQKDPLYRNNSDNGFVFVIGKGAAPEKWSSAQQPQHGSFMPIFYVYNVDKDTPTVAVKVRAPNRETAVQHAMKIEPSFKDLDLMQIHALNSLPKREVTDVIDGGTAEDPRKVGENFADGKNPQDKGDSGRHGIKKGITIAQLKKIRSSDSASPRKKQLAHWQINMRQGRSKKG